MQFQQQKTHQYKMQPSYERNLYPLCIVWTLLPCISWLVPWIGHTGICDQNGIIYDFLGFHINKKNMAFGNPKKYVQLDIPPQSYSTYRNCLKQINEQFSNKAHDICCNNCHHHVAEVLNLYGYRGRRDWTQVSIWWMCIWEGKYTTWWAPLLTYLPFLLIVGGIILIVTLTKR